MAQAAPLIAGIDLGTTNSLIGVVDSGFPIVLADENGLRLTSSVVHFSADGSPPLAGELAVRRRRLDPERTVTSIKRLMGQTGRIGPSQLLPEEISSVILKRLKTYAEEAMQREITRAVITVPAYFNDAQRTATKRAGELAGFHVERILNEPTAAALAYGLDKLGERSRIAVYDLGGGTFDISILELREGVFEVLATAGDTQLGGDDIDAAILGVLTSEFSRPLSLAARARLWEAAIAAKHALSSDEAHTIALPFLEGGFNFEYSLTRAELESIARPIIERTRHFCLRALADARIEFSDLDEVILVGGVTRMPLVRHQVAELFGRHPNLSQHPDEAVALGATIQAGILGGVLSNVLLLDVTPLSLGIETFGGLMNVIIPRNTTIPCRAGEMFTNAVTAQREMLIRVLQGEREMARDNWDLGQFQLDFEPGPKGSARIGVQFEIDENGILRVLARDTKTNTDRVLDIRSAAVNVDDERVENMVASSVAFAFEDMRERTWTEALQKAHELLPAVEQALAQAGDLIDAAERAGIVQKAAELRAAIDARDTNRLNPSVKLLDQATEHLAARLVDRAIEDSLRKKGIQG
ncbi:MAG: Hsp70 family protein [Verrucomicrobiales bacterium]